MFTPIRVLSNNGPVRVELARWDDQLVVIKKLQNNSQMFSDRLQREAAVLQKLKHENIVPLLHAQGNMIVYSYVPGVNLSEALQAGALPISRSIKIAIDVLKGLSYTHKNGIIHFDVKPGNIIVRGESALIADFGFAKDQALTAITSENIMLGTPNYMAPEQFRGERDDPRSDIYAIGAVLYHMLAGFPPYSKQVIQFLIGDRTVELEPLPRSARQVHDIVYKSLSYLPEQRFQDADSFIAELSQAIGIA